jgi:hypothetical protein
MLSSDHQRNIGSPLADFPFSFETFDCSYFAPAVLGYAVVRDRRFHVRRSRMTTRACFATASAVAF